MNKDYALNRQVSRGSTRGPTLEGGRGGEGRGGEGRGGEGRGGEGRGGEGRGGEGRGGEGRGGEGSGVEWRESPSHNQPAVISMYGLVMGPQAREFPREIPNIGVA